MSNVVIEARETAEMLDDLRYAKLVKKSDVRKMIREELKPVRKKMMEKFKMSVERDPRRASQGVKIRVYRDANGGNVSILDSRKVSRMAIYKRGTGGKSGIRRRRPISDRTKQVAGYTGRDRAFILRFINHGTSRRKAGEREGTMKSANRGRLKPSNFFDAARGEMQNASKRLTTRLEKLITEVVNDESYRAR